MALRAVSKSVLQALRQSSSRAIAVSAARGVICGRPQRRALATAASGAADDVGAAAEESNGSEFLQGVLSGILAPYWERTPSAEGAISLLEDAYPQAMIGFDHLAFRSFGLPHLGVASLASIFEDFGYRRRGELAFPAKALRALWFSPPAAAPDLPRLFISELQVERLSAAAQEVVRKYAGEPERARVMGRHSVLSSVLGILPWDTPTLEDYRALAAESEYAAWTLVNGYALNHTTVAVHQLAGLQGGLARVNQQLLEAGFVLNEEGGLIKVSPDGLLLQSSTMADRLSFTFADEQSELVPGSYIEFAERLPLPQFVHLPPEALQEHHRRDGFEVSNASHIFESTRGSS